MFDHAIKLESFYQRYDWGTESEIPDLLGLPKPPGTEPLAEYWMGAHPGLPSKSDSGVPLNQLITQYPQDILGERYQSMGARLPYLFKVLSAGRALSIQVHPNKQQAEQGFAKERAAGITESSANCNYKDDNHKPELMYALTPFKAMVGFRPMQEVKALLTETKLAFFKAYIEDNENNILESLYRDLLYIDEASLKTLCAELIQFSASQMGEPWQTLINLHEIYGDDPGVCFPLLLNVVTLEPGQAVFLGAGIPHAYLRGTGLEVMANSDNVLRGGLTKKYMDKEELIRVTEYNSLLDPIQNGKAHGQSLQFDIPCPDFQFEIIETSDESDKNSSFILGDSGSAELILVMEGTFSGNDQTFKQSECYLLPAKIGAKQYQGKCTVARVSTKL